MIARRLDDFIAMSLLCVLVLSLTGCGPAATPSPMDGGVAATEAPAAESPAPAQTEEARPQGTITIAVAQDFFYLDPHQTIMMSDSSIHAQIHETLVWFNAQAELQPLLATSWENVSPTEWIFHLREGVSFQNGEVFNADTVVYNAERALGDWAQPRQPLIAGYLETAERIDDYTVRLITPQPDPVFLAHLTGFWMVPPAYVAEVGDDNYAEHPIGTGPYEFVEHVRDDHLTLTANLDYWGEPPSIETVIYRVIPEPASRVAALMAGEVDIAPIPVDSYDVVDEDPNLSAVAIEGGVSPWVFFFSGSPQNPDSVALEDVRVRQALNYAVDVDAITEGLFGGLTSRLGAHIPPLLWGYDPTIEPYPYDPEMARDLLEEAGYPELTLNLEVPIGLMMKPVEVGEAIAAYLEAVGVHSTVTPVEVSALLGMRDAGTAAPLHIIPWGQALFDSWDKLYYPLHCESPYSMWCDPQLDELIDASNIEMDPERRQEILTEIQVFVHEQAPFVFLYAEPFVFGYNDRVVGFEPRADEKILAYGCSLSEP